MKVFVMGGTGSIGQGIIQELVSREVEVTALSRSLESDKKLRQQGAAPFRGDLAEPQGWIDRAVQFDALIQVAATFDEHMAQVDQVFIDALSEAVAKTTHKLRILYTGGCWLYGDTGGEIATEESGFRPISSFRWMVDGADKIQSNPHLSAVIIHPAMVYDKSGGVFEDFFEAAQTGKEFEIWGQEDVRWPLVERSDLARAYYTLLGRHDLEGHFNVTSEDGVYVSQIVKAVADHHGVHPSCTYRDVESLTSEYGDWAKGPTLDQQMSSAKLQEMSDWYPVYTDFRNSPLFQS